MCDDWLSVASFCDVQLLDVSAKAITAIKTLSAHIMLDSWL